ncbi:Uncharacterized protein dnm_043470 [Desulfonema magnum]|uniref:Uncharacterized protein n=1 Tax=Desulfonema magnum TaxID=45655 RepID=A0A975GNZ7_9BACT|nr:Uncharacterized protein dnm_043470 [Desulfonema magnum]
MILLDNKNYLILLNFGINFKFQQIQSIKMSRTLFRKSKYINGHELPVTTNDESFMVFPDT